MSKEQVVILCGGLGTRLREETEFKPKPMIEIGEKPILWHIMKIYSSFGFNDFVLCLGYKSEVIRNYFLNYYNLNSDLSLSLSQNTVHVSPYSNDEVNWNVILSDTGRATLKGARIKKIEKFITGDTFMLTYGDGVANIDINDLLRFHKEQGCVGTITGVSPPSRFGEMIIRDKRVASFTEKPQSSGGLINGGFFVFNRKIFDFLSDDENCDFEVGALEQLTRNGELAVYALNKEWACMDTIRDVEYLNRLWNNGNAFWRT